MVFSAMILPYTSVETFVFIAMVVSTMQWLFKSFEFSANKQEYKSTVIPLDLVSTYFMKETVQHRMAFIIY